MKGISTILICSLLILTIVQSAVVTVIRNNTKSQAETKNKNPRKNDRNITWEQFKARYNKSYSNSSEDAQRKATFESHVKRLARLNCTNCGISPIGDRSLDQIKSHYGSKRGKPAQVPDNLVDIKVNSTKRRLAVINNGPGELPLNFSWTNSGYGGAAPFRNLGNCRSDWALASSTLLQNIYMISQRKYFSLSQRLSNQYIMQCDRTSFGCNGGYPFAASAFGLKRGMFKYTAFPYMAQIYTPYTVPMCGGKPSVLFNTSLKVAAWQYPYPAEEEAIMRRLFRRPVIANINGVPYVYYMANYQPNVTGDMVFQIYGCFPCQHYGYPVYEFDQTPAVECSPTQNLHAVTMFGWGSWNGDAARYWIIRNSYGDLWSNDALMKLTAAQDQGCGLSRNFAIAYDDLKPEQDVSDWV